MLNTLFYLDKKRGEEEVSYINPISKTNWEENKEPTLMKTSTRTAAAECPSRRGKTHNIKIPVLQMVQMKLKTYCK